MKLERRYEWDKTDFRCDLTYLLDELSLLDQMPCYDLHHHYLLIDKIALEEKILPIRVPGGTIGAVFINENNEIAMIKIDRDYVVKTYPANINELLLKFIDEAIELPN